MVMLSKDDNAVGLTLILDQGQYCFLVANCFRSQLAAENLFSVMFVVVAVCREQFTGFPLHTHIPRRASPW